MLEAVQRLRPIADGLGVTMAQLAIAWVLREENVSSAIVGASRPEQVDDNVAASGVELERRRAGARSTQRWRAPSSGRFAAMATEEKTQQRRPDSTAGGWWPSG